MPQIGLNLIIFGRISNESGLRFFLKHSVNHAESIFVSSLTHTMRDHSDATLSQTLTCILTANIVSF